MNRFFPVVFLILFIFIFFKVFLIQGKLPIPSDTIIGLYHPFRDLYAKDYPRGIPFKNFLITDPVRQQYPWRELAVTLEKKLQLPLWNPYHFAGTPLLANFQTAPFYPLNVLFLLLPFSLAWSVLVVLQPLLAGLFIYFYLIHIRLNKWASILGTIVFSFAGFSIAWLEWNTIGHVALWSPLILLSIDKVISTKNKKLVFWSFVFIFSLISSFLAGHLQTFFYLYLISLVYFIGRWVQFGKKSQVLILFIIQNLLFIIITSVQWIPTLQFIGESARNVDQVDWQKEGWFIPPQHLIQFIVPDFFGNPTTLNYWGVWNYAEFIGYVGILPLVLAIFALFFRRDRKTLFFGTFFFLSLLFSVPTIFAKLPFILQIPFLSAAQPTRLLSVTDFSLAILAALGFDYFHRDKKGIIYSVGFVGIIIAGAWLFVVAENLAITKRNLILPTIIFASVSLLLIFLWKFKKTNKPITLMIYIILIAITGFDLIRFGQKFTSFTNKEYLFPQTEVISFLQKQPEHFRIMTTDDRILPPNFSTIYRIQSIDGYDPLYLRRYAELIAASERVKPNINPPFGFNRIITPHRVDSKIIDLLGVKYVLSLSDISSVKLKKVFQEGQTRVYENKQIGQRAFLAEAVLCMSSKQETIEALFDSDIDLRRIALVEDAHCPGAPRNAMLKPTILLKGKSEILTYSENRIVIKTESNRDALLVLTDSFYPTWKAKIDGKETKIYRTDYHFRGIFVPKGNHLIEFSVTLL